MKFSDIKKDECPFCDGTGGHKGIIDPDNFTNNLLYGRAFQCEYCNGTGEVTGTVLIQLTEDKDEQLRPMRKDQPAA